MRVSLRPDPSKGVFETMLVLDGRPVELVAHMERLSSSVSDLYDRVLPDRFARTVIEEAAGLHHGRLRITVLRGGDGWLRSRVDTAAVDRADVFPSSARAIALHSFVAEDGLGAHKWADRRLLEEASKELPQGGLPLLVDGDGTVLEASRGSVFLTRGGEIVTPQLDGRILPGIARHQVLQAAAAEGVKTREERLAVAELTGGDEIFIAGSVRGVEPVRAVDSAGVPTGGEVSRRIAAALRRRWLRPPQVEPVAAAAGARPAGRPAR